MKINNPEVNSLLENNQESTEVHPFQPFLPAGAKLLMCGTFPPQKKRWSMNFYYPNYINDMWRIFGLILEGDKDYFVDSEAKSFKEDLLRSALSNLGVALSDTGSEVVRTAGNASDKYLEIRKQIDLGVLLTELPDCIAVATTGEKAASVISLLTNTTPPKMGEYNECSFIDSRGNSRKFRHWRMPSSSRAYPMKLDIKAEYYAKMLQSVFGITPKL